MEEREQPKLGEDIDMELVEKLKKLSYSREYWHYSYGDAYWAVRRKNKVAIYGIPQEK